MDLNNYPTEYLLGYLVGNIEATLDRDDIQESEKLVIIRDILNNFKQFMNEDDNLDK